MNFDRPHRRLNLLTGEWVLVSPHRAKRPWLGQVEKIPTEKLPEYDPDCYLCPGNKRTSGAVNDHYPTTFVFDNDFAALLPPKDFEGSEGKQDDLLIAEPETGLCRVVCFSPRHDLSLPELSQEEVVQVIRTWRDQTSLLSKIPGISYVQVFENKGAVMGCSNPHPHSQIWATTHIPNQPQIEALCQEDYLKNQGKCLLCSYLQKELGEGIRIVVENAHFFAVVPFWAVWPFEILVLSKRHLGTLMDLTGDEESALADVMRQISIRYDNLFEISFPYSMGFHQRPLDGKKYPGWHFHLHYYPPLLRSATVRKFMVGFEMLGMPQRDLTPETAAARLRDCEMVHYKSRN